MIDLNKSREFFNPSDYSGKTFHIVGCGAVGSHVATLLARLGIDKFTLWDEDIVSSHNIANQNFVFDDIGSKKTEVVAKTIKAINPDATVTCKGFVTESDMPSGYIFVCVDSIAVRKMIAQYFFINPSRLKGLFDFRMGLTDGQFYCVSNKMLSDYINTMNFTDEEADALTPKSACNFELSVAYSIWAMLGMGMAQAVKYLKGDEVPMTSLCGVNNLYMMSL